MGRVRFSPVPPNDADRVTVPDGFRSDVVISWGDPILPGAPAFDVDAQTPAKARRQFGYNNDFLAVLPLRRETALMFSNHEYTNEELMFPTGAYDEETQKRIAMASHGLSVVKLRRGARAGSVQGRRPRQRLQPPLPHRHALRRRRSGRGHPADAHQRRP